MNATGNAVGARVGVGVGVIGTGVCAYTVGAGAISAAWGCLGPGVVARPADGKPWVARPITAPSSTMAAAATAATNRSLRLNRGRRRGSSHDARDDTHDASRSRARARPLDLGSASRE